MSNVPQHAPSKDVNDDFIEDGHTASGTLPTALASFPASTYSTDSRIEDNSPPLTEPSFIQKSSGEEGITKTDEVSNDTQHAPSKDVNDDFVEDGHTASGTLPTALSSFPARTYSTDSRIEGASPPETEPSFIQTSSEEEVIANTDEKSNIPQHTPSKYVNGDFIEDDHTTSGTLPTASAPFPSSNYPTASRI